MSWLRRAGSNRRSANKAPRSRLKLWSLEERLTPATFVVSVLGDGAGATLRNQIIAANGAPGADVITFDKTVFASAQTITLTAGEIAISGDLKLAGPAAKLSISGNNSSRIFNINGAGTIIVDIQDIALTNGKVTGVSEGGAIFIQDEDVSLINCTVSSNTSADSAGAIQLEAAGAKLTVDLCTIQSNTAGSAGGAIAADASVTVSLINSTFSGNQSISGGALNLPQGGSVTITGCTFALNVSNGAGNGGAVFLNNTFSTAKIQNSTLSGNLAGGSGGAIVLSTSFTGTLTVNNCTLANNQAIGNDGGAIARLGGTGTISLTSSIVSKNLASTTAEDLFTGGTVNATLCLVGTKTGVTTFTGDAFTNTNLGVDPLLGAIGNHGGPTSTQVPGAGSKAIDNGSNPDGATTDQRGTGYLRVRGKAADIGAFETPDDFVVTNVNNSGAGSLRQAILDANSAVGDDTIVFDATAFAGPQNIILGGTELLISDDLLIDGPTAKLTVTANNLSRVFNIDGTNGLTVAVQNMTLTAGKSAGFGGAVNLTNDTVTLTNCNISDSEATNSGGGLAVSVAGGSLTLVDCKISGNKTAVSGGGIMLFPSTTLVIDSSTLSGNTSAKQGGAIYVFSTGSATIRNNTISGNTAATDGGGIHMHGSALLAVYNSTVTKNTVTSGTGGGIGRDVAGTTSIVSTIVQGNSATTGPDLASPGTMTVNDSLIGSKAGVTTFVGNATTNALLGADPLLGPLQSNGNSNLFTHLPAQDSPVLSKGSNPTGLTSEQRGGTAFPRLRGAGVDIGAVEVQQLLVTNTSGALSGAGTLGQAVADATTFGGVDTITFDPTVFATNQVINLAGTLILNSSMNIQGPASKVTLSGVAANRIFSMANGVDYDFSNLNLTLGKSTSDGGAASINQANADVTFTNCAISFNTTTTEGGAIATTAISTNAKLTFIDCTLSNNTTTGVSQDGGAIRTDGTATIILIRTTLSNNKATGDGGAISLATGSSLLVQDSTLSTNEATLTGGAISLNGSAGGTGLKIINSTLSGNKSALDGGGLSWTTSSGTLTIQNSTITNNTASGGGGGGLSITTGTADLNIESTIVSGNTNVGAPDIDNPNKTYLKTSAVGSNLGFAKTTDVNNLAFGTNLKLGVLSNNGGPTNTHVPAIDSPLRNVGSNPALLTTDQRGFDRFLSGGIDIGSAEHFDAIVRNTNDAGQDSLRNAIANAIAIPGSFAITFDKTVFTTAKTITLTTGQIDINETMTINGPIVGVTVSGNNASRIFDVDSPGAITFTGSKLTLTQGKAIGQTGGAIRTRDDLIDLTDCILTGNTGTHGGAIGIDQGGGLYATRCTFTNNSSGFGGAIDIFGSVASGGTKLTDCTLTGNSADTRGGAIYCINVFQMTGSTVSNNTSAGDGGGIYLAGEFKIFPAPALVVNSTVSGNTASVNGGGIALANFSGYDFGIVNSTVTGNSAGTAGGAVALLSGTGNVTAISSIVFGDSAPTGPEFSVATKVVAEASLIGSKSGITTFTPDAFTLAKLGVDPLLGPLQNNGGITLTHLPSNNSPALGNGSNSTFGVPNDQRGAGFPRSFGGAVEIGAVEIRVFQVLNTNDSGAGSLRQAIIDSNALAGPDTITFSPTVFAASKLITLTTGELVITDSLTILGPSIGVTVSGNNASRVFNIDGPGTLNVVISDVGMVSGNAAGSNDGGAIFVQNEIMTLTRCTLSQNNAANGAGIFLAATGAGLTLFNCTVSANFAGNSGGGIGALGSAAILIQDSSIFANSAQVGGGLHQAGGGSLTVIGSTFSGNTASTGGGGGAALFNTFSTTLLRNSTISSNTALGGGGITLAGSFFGTLVGQNSTITGNTSTGGVSGGGIDSAVGGTGKMTLTSTIVSGNTSAAAPDIRSAGTVNANFSAIGSNVGFTLSGSSGNNLSFGANLKLGALAINGGPTLTHLPAVDSPLVNAGNNPAALTTDQRGFNRVIGAGIEIGAIESRSLVVANTNDAGTGSLRQNILDANTLAGPDTITFDPAIFGTSKTITLTTGELTISDDATITGPGVGVTVDGNNAGRILNIQDLSGAPTVILEKLTLTAGKVTGTEDGGAIRSDSKNLTLRDCTLSNNSAGNFGGAIAAAKGGAINLERCSLIGNNAGKFGGALLNLGVATYAISDCLFSSNNSGSIGGAIAINGGSGFTMRNSTVSGNTAASNGGGIMFGGGAGLVVDNSTIVNNSAAQGGGLYSSPSGILTIRSTIISGNSASSGQDIHCLGTTNVDFSAIGSANGFTLTGANNLPFGTDLLLGPLQNNGGPTLTHLPAATSKVVNNGSNPASLITDQRGAGFVRVFGGAIDIGAVETRTFVVSNTNDSGAGSLRQNIADANALPGPDIILFDANVFATAKSIVLTTGKMTISETLTIVGPVAGVTVNANKSSAIISATGATMALDFSRMTFTNSNASNSAIEFKGTLTMTDCTVTGNTRTGLGGGAINGPFSGNTLNLTRCTVSININSVGTGGGISLSNIGNTVTIRDCTISGNSAGGDGGGAELFGTVTILNSTFSGNTSNADGGGIKINGFGDVVTIQNSTFTANKATGLGGAIAHTTTGIGSLQIASSVFFGDSAATGPEFSAKNVAATTSVIGSKAGVTNFTGDTFTNVNIGVNPLLGPLANNGGPTQTHAILPGSPLINAGSNPAGLTTDQRGFNRIEGGSIDIGALESKLAPTVRSVVVNDGSTQRSRVTSLTVDFDAIVSFSGAPVGAFSLKRQSDNALPPLQASVTNTNVTRVILTFLPGAAVDFGSLADGKYTLTIDNSKVSANGAQLDGNIDGVGGDNFILVGSPATTPRLFRLFGDGNGDGSVTASDFNEFRLAYGSMGASFFDFDGDNQVSASDFNQFRTRYGITLVP